MNAVCHFGMWDASQICLQKINYPLIFYLVSFCPFSIQQTSLLFPIAVSILFLSLRYSSMGQLVDSNTKRNKMIKTVHKSDSWSCYGCLVSLFISSLSEDWNMWNFILILLFHLLIMYFTYLWSQLIIQLYLQVDQEWGLGCENMHRFCMLMFLFIVSKPLQPLFALFWQMTVWCGCRRKYFPL